jgi:hypothetical protein
MKRGNLIIVTLLLISLVFISGQEGCEQQSQIQTGIDFTLIKGVSFLTPPKILEKGESFRVGVHLENYNPKDEEGIVCVRDNLADSFYGIPSEGDGDCQSFFVRASEVISEQEQSPGTVNLYFPEQGQYTYQGLPELNKAYDATLFVSMKYQQDSQVTGTVTSPDEQQPIMSQDPQPIRATVEKSVFMIGDNYQINLEIHLKNTRNVEIFSPDFVEKEKIYFLANMKPLTLQCTDVHGVGISGLTEFENEKIIKCLALTSSKTQQSYPLVITLDYGVNVEREYKFGINTKINQ